MRTIKYLTISLLLIISTVTNANNWLSIEQIRYKYIQAVNSSTEADQLLSALTNEANEPLRIAYKGAAEALIAKHSWNPHSKLKYLARSQTTLQKAISLRPYDPEIRFLRYSIQYYVPAFLGYSGNLDEDKNVIIKNINLAQGQVKQVIVQFMLSTGKCSKAEIQQLKSR